MRQKDRIREEDPSLPKVPLVPPPSLGDTLRMKVKDGATAKWKKLVGEKEPETKAERIRAILRRVIALNLK